VIAATAGVLLQPAVAEKRACPRPDHPLAFHKQTYVDLHRAGGEPTVETHPNGLLLYSSHAGTTHVYGPAAADPTSAAFVQKYTGQSYYYWSSDNGATWTFVDRTLPPKNLAGSGFSDPEFAIDNAGQVYNSEINLANVAVSKSTTRGRSYDLQNFFAQTITDRQWMEADRKDQLYLVGNAFAGGTFPTKPVGNVGHIVYKSTDGGITFTEGVPHEGGLGDIQVNKKNGVLYEADYSDGNLGMAIFPKARRGDLGFKVHPIAKGVDMLSHWPSFDLDEKGNLYIVWDESGRGSRPAGVWYSYSKNAGRDWVKPIRVDGTDRTDIWPWLAVGDPGRVAFAWLEADRKLPNHDAQTPGDHGWRVKAAATLTGLGCGRSNRAGFRRAVATPDPVHRGTICQGGTACQAQGIDRRLGDFFTIEIDKRGLMWGGYSDTRQGGSVALPGLVRQRSGPRFLSADSRR
jgi:hypothetical protein